MEIDRREHPRKRIDRSLEVCDLSRGIVLGQLVDISPGGLMILGAEPVVLGGIYRLGLDLAGILAGEGVIEFGAESLWREPCQDQGQHWTGFRVIAIAVEDAERLRQLMTHL